MLSDRGKNWLAEIRESVENLAQRRDAHLLIMVRMAQRYAKNIQLEKVNFGIIITTLIIVTLR